LFCRSLTWDTLWRQIMIVPVHNCITPQLFTKLLLYLNNIWTIIVFELTSSVSIVDFDSGDSILIFEVNRPPGPIGRASPVRVGAHAARSTVFLYPVHCLVCCAIPEHTRVLLCRLSKGNIWTCKRVTLSLLDCLYCCNCLFRRVFFIKCVSNYSNLRCTSTYTVSGLFSDISGRSIFTPKATAIFH